MSDPAHRLAELLRQRAAISAHLAWIDAEIARAQLPALSPTPPPAELHPDAAHSETGAPENLPPSADSAAERILAEYHASRRDVRDEVRRGCLLYFALAMALVALLLAVLYYVSNMRQTPRVHAGIEMPVHA